MIRYLLYLLVIVVQVCFSEEINCKTLETGNGTFYVVPDFTDSDCGYSWSNSSDHVLANNEEINELIIASNSTSLHTYSCHETIKYSRDCMSEGPKTAKCFANCTRSERLSDVKGLATMEWLIPLLVCVVIPAVVGILYLFRDTLSRWRKHCYTVGKPNNDENQVTDVIILTAHEAQIITSKDSLLKTVPT